jgi:hypothetical protein
LSWIDWFRGLPERAARYDVSFTPEEVDLILGGNAAACLGLDPGDGSARRSQSEQDRRS